MKLIANRQTPQPGLPGLCRTCLPASSNPQTLTARQRDSSTAPSLEMRKLRLGGGCDLLQACQGRGGIQPSLLASRPVPCNTLSLLTDGGEKAELISSSIDSNFSIEIDLPIKKGRADSITENWRPRTVRQLAAQQMMPCLSSGHLTQTGVAMALGQQQCL